MLEVAVVGKNDEKWGEVPCAFIKLKDNMKITEDDIIKFCYENMARFKVPKKIIFLISQKHLLEKYKNLNYVNK